MTDKTRLLDALQELSDAELREVAEFIDSLRSRTVAPRPGSAEAVLRAVGTWWMTPDETEQFQKDIKESRNEDAGCTLSLRY